MTQELCTYKTNLRNGVDRCLSTTCRPRRLGFIMTQEKVCTTVTEISQNPWYSTPSSQEKVCTTNPEISQNPYKHSSCDTCFPKHFRVDFVNGQANVHYNM